MQTIVDVPALKVKFVFVVVVIELPLDKVIVEALRLMVLTFGLLELIEPAANE